MSDARRDPDAKGGVADEWCTRIRALRASPAPDVVGRANDNARVDAIRAKYREQFMRLPGVVMFGMTTMSTTSESHANTSRLADGALVVGVVDESFVPERPLYIEGVAIVVEVTGQPHRVA
jgi:hypothetical protein